LRFWLLFSAVAPHDDQLLTASQAAQALNATGQTIRNWIRSGRLSAVRIGARFYVPADEVERLRGEGARASRAESIWEFEGDADDVALPRAARSGAAVDGELGG
jgi:excisionase family DNA binding protein